MRKRALAHPPPELLYLPQRTSTAALRTACTQALHRVYRMLKGFQVCSIPPSLHQTYCMLDICSIPHCCMSPLGCQCNAYDLRFTACPSSFLQHASQTCSTSQAHVLPAWSTGG